MIHTPTPDWRDGIRIHPAAAQDIEANGLCTAVAWLSTSEGPELLDGRNRLAAISLIADEHRRAELQQEVQRTGKLLPAATDPLAYVFSANNHRRHLTAAAKRKLIAKLLEAYPDLSDRAIATLVGTSHTTVAAVRVGANGQSGHKPVARREASGRKARGRKAGSSLAVNQAAKRAARPSNSSTGRGSTGEITGPPPTRTTQEVEWIARLLQAVTALAAMPADARYIVDLVRSSTSAEPVAAQLFRALTWLKEFYDEWDRPTTAAPLLASSRSRAEPALNGLGPSGGPIGPAALSSRQAMEIDAPSAVTKQAGQRPRERTLK